MNASAPIRLPHNGWAPRRHQNPLWMHMQRGGRRAVAICHRRWGKDDVCLHWAARAAHERVADYWHALPEYAQARKAIWQAVNPHTGKRRIDEAFPRELRESTNQTEMSILFKNGSRWRVVGSDNPDSLVGSAPAGLVFSEWALANPSAWAYLAPIVEENNGWAMFITTPRGRNHAFSMYEMARKSKDWLALRSSVIESGYPLDRIEAQREEYHSIFGEDAGDALIEQEFYCFPPGTPIWTDRGQKPIEQVALGDTVLSHAGRWRKVKRLYQHDHIGEMVEIFNAGSPRPLVCTPTHPVQICDPATQEYRWVPAGEVEPGQYVCMPRLKIPKGSPLDPGMVELIGWFVAEGSVARTAVQFSISKKETHVAKRIAELGARFGRVSQHPAKDTGGHNVVVQSAWLADFLVSACGSGADVKRIPWHLIAGHEQLLYETLIEGDGCRGDYSGPRDVYTTISHSLALDVQMLAHMLGLRASVNFRPKEKAAGHFQGRPTMNRDAYSVRISVIKKNAKYYGEHTRPEILPQKHGVAAKVRTVKRRTYWGPVYNFSVQFDESYVADGRIVHNCSFDAAILGSYWGKALQRLLDRKQICEVFAEPGQPIHRAWDLGIGDSTAIWFFQMFAGEIRILDYYENHGVGMEHYAGVIREEFTIRGGIDFVPHDARARVLTAGGKTRVETMIELKLNPEVVPLHSREDGINAVRRILPRCWFDASRCEKGLEKLRHYRAKWDDDKKTFSNEPVHDFSSHPADAFRYLAMAYEPLAQAMPKPKTKILQISAPGVTPLQHGLILPVTGNEISGVTLDELFELNERGNHNPSGYQ